MAATINSSVAINLMTMSDEERELYDNATKSFMENKPLIHKDITWIISGIEVDMGKCICIINLAYASGEISSK